MNNEPRMYRWTAVARGVWDARVNEHDEKVLLWSRRYSRAKNTTKNTGYKIFQRKGARFGTIQKIFEQKSLKNYLRNMFSYCLFLFER